MSINSALGAVSRTCLVVFAIIWNCGYAVNYSRESISLFYDHHYHCFLRLI